MLVSFQISKITSIKSSTYNKHINFSAFDNWHRLFMDLISKPPITISSKLLTSNFTLKGLELIPKIFLSQQIRVEDDHLCHFNYSDESLNSDKITILNKDYKNCWKLESFFYLGSKFQGIVPVSHSKESERSLTALGVRYNLFKDLINKFKLEYFNEDYCIAGISQRNKDPNFDLLSRNEDDDYTFMMICSDSFEKISEFTGKFNSEYEELLLKSSDYFSIKSLANNLPVKVKYYSENVHNNFDDAYLLLRDESFYISDSTDYQCKSARFTTGYQQIMQCLPNVISKKSKEMAAIVADKDKGINPDCCFSYDVESGKELVTNTLCFADNEYAKCNVLTKLFNVSLSKNCLASQMLNYKKEINDNKNHLLCLFPSAKLVSENPLDAIRFKNLIRLVKIMYTNINETRQTDTICDTAFFYIENFQELYSKMEELTGKKEVNSITLNNSNNNILEKIKLVMKEEDDKMQKDIDEGMTGTVDSKLTVNYNWTTRNNDSVQKAPLDFLFPCNSAVQLRVDPLKDYIAMKNRIAKREAANIKDMANNIINKAKRTQKEAIEKLNQLKKQLKEAEGKKDVSSNSRKLKGYIKDAEKKLDNAKEQKEKLAKKLKATNDKILEARKKALSDIKKQEKEEEERKKEEEIRQKTEQDRRKQQGK